MANEELIEVCLVRSDLVNLPWPRYHVPAPYTLRSYQPGDRRTWVQVHLLSERYHSVDEDLHRREFGEDEEALAQRQLFLLDGTGNPIGTASAWYGEDAVALPGVHRAGRIHWVAVAEAHQGKGLGKALVSALCDRFLALGHREVFVTTESVRLPALRLYLHFGFVPKARTQMEQETWDGLFKPSKV